MKNVISSALAGLIFSAGLIAIGAPSPRYEAVAANNPVSKPQPVFATCSRQNLRLRLMSSDAAMGGVRGNLYRIKNVGANSCTLEGFPRLRLYNSSWHPAYNSHVKHSDGTPSEVTLAHNGYAYFDVEYHALGAGAEPGQTCPAVSRERFWMPGVIGAFIRRDHIDLCDDVIVSPLRANETE